MQYSYHALLGPQCDAIVRSCKYSAGQGFSISSTNRKSISLFRRYGMVLATRGSDVILEKEGEGSLAVVPPRMH
jgi:hypothetical protein